MATFTHSTPQTRAFSRVLHPAKIRAPAPARTSFRAAPRPATRCVTPKIFPGANQHHLSTTKFTSSPSPTLTIDQRVQRLEDESAIARLSAQFADAATRRDYDTFANLWHRPQCSWSIADPFRVECKSFDEIVALIKALRDPKEFFVQMVHSGIVDFDREGKTAKGRWICEEIGRGPGIVHYRNYAYYVDELVKVEGQWKFTDRKYEYMFLDMGEFGGEVVDGFAGKKLVGAGSVSMGA